MDRFDTDILPEPEPQAPDDEESEDTVKEKPNKPLKPKRTRIAKQLAIPGTERLVNPDIELASDAYRDSLQERDAIAKEVAHAKANLHAIMLANGLRVYRYHDDDGVEIEARIEDTPNVRIRKTGEVDAEHDPNDPNADLDDDNAPANGHGSNGHDGLIAQAMRAQAQAMVDENEDGDVVPPEAPPGTSNGKKRRKKKAAK